jgi:hypothetical protein
MSSPHLLFVTGRLAEFALRRILEELAPRIGITASVVVLPITVIALATTRWIATHLTVPPGIERIILPGLCQGDLALVESPVGVPVQRGPADLRDLPDFFRASPRADAQYGAHNIQILAEINHAPQMALDDLLAQADALRAAGADLIDVGCDPGEPWLEGCRVGTQR